MSTTAPIVLRNLADLCRRAGEPLSDAQELLMIGALGVWLEKAREEARLHGVCGFVLFDRDEELERARQRLEFLRQKLISAGIEPEESVELPSVARQDLVATGFVGIRGKACVHGELR